MRKNRNVHWTSKSAKSLQYFVGSDFVDQLRDCMESAGISQRELAERLKLTESRISQVFNEPGNLTLGTMVDWTHALGFKASVVVYDDGDRDVVRGPLSGQVFYETWVRCGSPYESMAFERHLSNETTTVSYDSSISNKVVCMKGSESTEEKNFTGRQPDFANGEAFLQIVA